MEWWSQISRGVVVVGELWEVTRIEPFSPQYSTNTFRMCGMVLDSVVRAEEGQKGRGTTGGSRAGHLLVGKMETDGTCSDPDNLSLIPRAEFVEENRFLQIVF